MLSWDSRAAASASREPLVLEIRLLPRPQQLQRNGPVELTVARLPNHAEAAAPQLADELEAADGEPADEARLLRRFLGRSCQLREQRRHASRCDRPRLSCSGNSRVRDCHAPPRAYCVERLPVEHAPEHQPNQLCVPNSTGGPMDSRWRAVGAAQCSGTVGSCPMTNG